MYAAKRCNTITYGSTGLYRDEYSKKHHPYANISFENVPDRSLRRLLALIGRRSYGCCADATSRRGFLLEFGRADHRSAFAFSLWRIS